MGALMRNNVVFYDLCRRRHIKSQQVVVMETQKTWGEAIMSGSQPNILQPYVCDQTVGIQTIIAAIINVNLPAF